MGILGWEERVLAAAADGEAADFSQDRTAFREGKGPEPVIEARVLRQFILRLENAPVPGGRCLSNSVRWFLEGATIIGTLDLQGGRLAEGGALPPLRFTDCIFYEGFRADGAHLQSLGFEGCKFGIRRGANGEIKASISLRDCCVQGEVRVCGAESVENGAYFRLDARSVQVGTNFVVRQSKFLAGPARERKGMSPDHYGLDLRDARIQSNIFLQPDVSVDGGVRLEGTRVQGNLWAEGLHVTDGETKDSRKRLTEANRPLRWAVRAQSARFEGHFLLRETEAGAKNAVAKGGVGMYGMHVGGTLDISGLQVENEGSPDPALLLTSARISAALIARNLSIKGGSVMHGMHVGGTMNIAGLQIENNGSPEPALQLSTARISSEIRAEDLSIKGSIAAQSCVIDGDLSLSGSTGAIAGQSSVIGGNLSLSGSTGAVGLQSCVIGGNLALSGSTEAIAASLITVKAYTALPVKAGNVDLWGATLGTLDLTSAEIGTETAPAYFDLRNASIAGDFVAHANLKITGQLAMQGCHIAGCMSLLKGETREIEASLMRVEGDVTLAVVTSGSVLLNGANIKGKVDLSGFGFAESPLVRFSTSTKPHSLKLVGCNIGHGLSVPNPGEFDKQLKLRTGQWTRLKCYPGFELLEAETSDSERPGELEWRWRGFLRRREGTPVALDGTSQVFHVLNRGGALNLPTEEEIKEYLRLFCAYVWDKQGAFTIVENWHQLPAESFEHKDRAILEQIGEITIDRQFNEDLKDLRAPLKLPEIGTLPGAEAEVGKDQLRTQLNRILEKIAFRAEAHVLHAGWLWKARFLIVVNSYRTELDVQGFPPEVEKALRDVLAGNVMMLRDESLLQLRREKLPTYKRPWRYGGESDFRPLGSWRRLSNELALSVLTPTWRGLFTDMPSLRNVEVDLSDASCLTLDDEDGRAWQECAGLLLENFSYTSVKSAKGKPTVLTRKGRFVRSLFREHVPGFLTKDFLWRFWFTQTTRASDTRVDWLRQGIGSKAFLPQPYTQLAKVFREQGDDDAAKRIEEEKIQMGIRERAKHELLVRLAKPLWAFYRWGFRYGLSPFKATITILVFLLLGWVGVALANSDGMLVLGTAPVSEVLVENGEVGIPVSAATALPDVSCKDSINQFLYAVDIFVPLLELKEESHCEIKRHYPPWTVVLQVLKLLYAVLGWIVISLALLTYSGVTRRWSQE